MSQLLENVPHVLQTPAIARVTGASIETLATAGLTGPQIVFRATVRCHPMQSGRRRKVHITLKTVSKIHAIGTVIRGSTKTETPALPALSLKTVSLTTGLLLFMVPLPLQRHA